MTEIDPNQNKTTIIDEEYHYELNFHSLFAEGTNLTRQGNYIKAIDAFTKALSIRYDDKNSLVARSYCYLQSGDIENALEDANYSLKDDKDFPKGILRKAEALYAQGDFEMALVYFHRGNKIRPEFDEFRLGIQKSKEAIDNSIGNPKLYKIPEFKKEKENASTTSSHVPITSSGSAKGKGKPDKEKILLEKKKKKENDMNIRRLLGELYEDKKYFEMLKNDRDLIEFPNEEIQSIIDQGLEFLDNRTEFWRQQKPIYARKKEHSQREAKRIYLQNKAYINKKEKLSQEKKNSEIEKPVKYKRLYPPSQYKNGITAVGLSKKTQNEEHTNIEIINKFFLLLYSDIQNRKFEKAIAIGNEFSEKLNKMNEIPDKNNVLCNYYNSMGICYMETKQYKEAFDCFKRDLNIAKDGLISEYYSRALGNIGRIYIKMKLYNEAIQVCELSEEENEKLKIKEIEMAWLNHDIGRCYLNMENYEKALEYGKNSHQIAQSINNSNWILASRALCGQSYTRLNNYEEALKYYELALETAKELNDQEGIRCLAISIENIKEK
ncbi:hypothetical protein PIROE2DRAFT_44600, partial [Piromyces sp. E2]